MPEYLSKEEVKQWRSSLEKITLEEFAARLGKVIEEDKKTNDIVDIALKGQPVMSRIDSSMTRSEKITSIAQRSLDREKELSTRSLSMPQVEKKSVEIKPKKEEKPSIKAEKTEIAEKISKPKSDDSLREEVKFVFRKALTDREQMVFEYFAQNKNKIVYAKDLASLLDLPRDYVYKYIKNLRAKIEGDHLQNADNGGYVLAV